MSPRELADYLRISLPTVHRYVKTGTIPFFRVGEQYRFDPIDVVGALKQQQAERSRLGHAPGAAERPPLPDPKKDD